MSTVKSVCPRCGLHAQKSAEPQPVAVITTDDGVGTALSEKDIDKRVGQASDKAWQAYAGTQSRRRKARAQLGTDQVVKTPDNDPSTYQKMASDEVQLRRRVEEVMVSEPKADLDKKGVQIIKRKGRTQGNPPK